jgi:hypothetical protein
VLAERPAVQGHNKERRAPDLEKQICRDEKPRAPTECLGDRYGHQEAGEHQPDEQQLNGKPVRLEPVRAPGGHVPRVEDRESQDHSFGARPQIDVLEEMVGELADREDVYEVEEQLKRGNDAFRVGRPRNSDPHCPDPTRGAVAAACAPFSPARPFRVGLPARRGHDNLVSEATCRLLKTTRGRVTAAQHRRDQDRGGLGESPDEMRGQNRLLRASRCGR